MEKEELEIICRGLTKRIEEMERDLQKFLIETIDKNPDVFYLSRIIDAFPYMDNIDKNWIAREAEWKARKSESRAARIPAYEIADMWKKIKQLGLREKRRK